jgi:peptidoglycan hydrolase-like protein with peptidoglycan-binding domain
MNYVNGGFSLSEPVGLRERNRMRDVEIVENLLGKSGYLDLKKTGGSTGFFGHYTDKAVKEFQKDHGLKTDGLLLPEGPTLERMTKLSNHRPYGHAAVSGPISRKVGSGKWIEEIESQGIPLPSPDGPKDRSKIPLPNPGRPWWRTSGIGDIDASGHAENGRLVDAIINTNRNGSVSGLIADALNSGKPKALDEVSNFLNQLSDKDPVRAINLSNEVFNKTSKQAQNSLSKIEQSVQRLSNKRQPVEAPIASLEYGGKPQHQPSPDRPASSTLADLGNEINKHARGILGPAYDQAAALMKLAEELSPGTDIQDAVDGSGDITEGIKSADLERVVRGTAMMTAGIAGIFVPGSASGIGRIVRTAEDGGKSLGKTVRRDITDMPYEQRLKHEGDAPVIPDSPKANIDRGYKSMAGVLKTGKADMAAMHRKDLGWIAFEPGDVTTKASGKIVGGGLKKIVAKHPQDLAMLPEVIQRGKIRFDMTDQGRRSAILEHNGYRTIFRLNNSGKRETWVLTHFFNEKGSELLR